LIGKVIKSNLGAAPLDFAVIKSTGWAGSGVGMYSGWDSPRQPERIEAALPSVLGIKGDLCDMRNMRSHFIGVLREAEITKIALAGTIPEGAFLPLLNGNAGVASASNPQDVKTVTISINKDGISELFPE
jgi:hypothetical protein